MFIVKINLVENCMDLHNLELYSFNLFVYIYSSLGLETKVVEADD